MARESYVYQLRVAYKRKPFYIGKGTGHRADAHFNDRLLKEKSHKNHTIKQAWQEGKKVYIEYLHENITDKTACRLEKQLIKHYGRRSEGGCLTNITEGGNSNAGHKHTEEALQKIRAASTGRVYSEETRRKLREAATNQVRGPVSDEARARMREAAKHKPPRPPMSDAQKEKLRQANLGRKHSRAARRKMSASRMGHTTSIETRAKIRESNLGRLRGPMSDEAKAKISKAMKGKVRTPEHSAAISFGKIGHKHSENAKQKMRDSAINRWRK